MPNPPATVVIVAYRTRDLDLAWLPPATPVVVVHNDRVLERTGVDHSPIVHLEAPTNIGFGAAVNRALSEVSTDRVILVNPDVRLSSHHWLPLADADPNDVVTIPLLDDDDRPTIVVSAYPNPAQHLLGGLRAGRLAPRGGWGRRALSRLPGLGDGAAVEPHAGPWPLWRRWVSGAVMSLPVNEFRAVGGFDPRYFLYYEDLDLCARLAVAFPNLRATLAVTPPGRHQVGAAGSQTPTDVRATAKLRLDSAITYAGDHPGTGWRATHAVLAARRRLARP